MDFNNLTLFAAFGSIVAFWGQIKGFISRIFSFFIRGDVIADSGQAINFLRETPPPNDLSFLEVNVDEPPYWASMKECVKAGAETWEL